MEPLRPKPAKFKILVIDDEAAVRASLERFITLQGYEVISAISGETGLKQLTVWAPDLIFLDITMPVMDGMVVLRTLHEKYPALPVVMLASSTDMGKANMALNCGASDFIPKPVDLPNIKRIFQVHLRLR